MDVPLIAMSNWILNLIFTFGNKDTISVTILYDIAFDRKIFF